MLNSPLDGRRLIRHPAHRTVGVSPAGWRACCIAEPDPTVARPSRPLAVCLVADGPDSLPGVPSREVCALLVAKLSATCFRAVDLRFCQSSDWRSIDRCDCALLLASSQLAAATRLRMERFCRSGKGVVAVCPARPGDRSSREPQSAVLGGACGEPAAGRPVEIRPVGPARHHPVLAGVEAFTVPGGISAGRGLAEDALVLMAAWMQGAAHPVAWVRGCGRGRVFCTSLGRAEDFRQTGFVALLANAVRWTARSDG
jgi:hypothetical protein